MPYGEEIIGLGNRTANENYVGDDVRQGFTGYENDTETGLDYAQARMYSNITGRFSSTDPIYIQSGMLLIPSVSISMFMSETIPTNTLILTGRYLDSRGI